MRLCGSISPSLYAVFTVHIKCWIPKENQKVEDKYFHLWVNYGQFSEQNAKPSWYLGISRDQRYWIGQRSLVCASMSRIRPPHKNKSKTKNSSSPSCQNSSNRDKLPGNSSWCYNEAKGNNQNWKIKVKTSWNRPSPGQTSQFCLRTTVIAKKLQIN